VALPHAASSWALLVANEVRKRANYGESIAGPPGKLPILKPGRAETVFYQGDVVTWRRLG
jgi:hypothetical protein